MPPKKNEPIAIVGGGAWGLSTALHLTRSGYTNVTIFERAPEHPSPLSAAYDLNKIVRAEYEDPFYTKLALEAIKEWKSPLFGPYFHETGYVVAATGRAPPKAIEHLEKAFSTIEKDPAFSAGIERLDGAADFKRYTWQYTGPLSGFKGYYNKLAGYAHSADTLKGIARFLATQGVRFVLGEKKGKVVGLRYDSRNGQRVATGVETADGKTHGAVQIIVALGAYAASLIPDVGKFVTARSWSVAHIQLTKEETDWLRGIPTTNVRDLGFFFEPDPETRLFKVCPLGAGFTNVGSDGTSLPPPGEQLTPRDFIPYSDEVKLRRLLQETFPWMADRPFVDKKLCWFADTADSDFLIDFVPRTGGSVVVLSGDSGHGFKMMPVFGKWVVELLEKGKQEEKRWQWKDIDLRGKEWGDAVSWRIGDERQLRDLQKEADALKPRARL